jgi:hypothetical protein
MAQVADGALTAAASGTTAVRAKEVVPLRAPGTIHSLWPKSRLADVRSPLTQNESAIKATNIEVNRKRRAADAENSWLLGLASMEAEHLSPGDPAREPDGANLRLAADRGPQAAFMLVSLWSCRQKANRK